MKKISKIFTLTALSIAMSVQAAPLTISAVKVYDVTANAAKVTWTVSQRATGQVQYGKTAAYGQESVKETSFKYKTHIQQLKGLTAGTVYHFRVDSQTRKGVKVFSNDSVFNTQGAVPTPTPVPTPAPVPVPTPVDGKIPAFPGAEGYGAETIGGRGGQVIEVTNLSDEGPGSFRAAVEASGPRIVVFRVGGTINTTGIRIVNPYLTVAGQTAPGGGIALKQVAGGIPEFFVLEGTHDVIIRGIRSRPGPVSENHGIAILDSRRIIVDHCSFSWAVDENIDFWYATEYVTIQNSIVSEGLMNSIHEKGGHSMAILIGSDAPDDSAGNISLHHNLIAHNNARHPLSEGNPNLQIINNLVYNYGAESAALEPGGGGSTIVDFIGNYYKSGPDSESGYAIVEAATNSEIYVKGNISASRSSLTDPEWDFVDASSGFQSSKAFCTGLPFPVTTTAYPNFVNPLLNSVGAFPRDSVDTRVVNDVKNGTGRIIDDPSQVGGWPTLAAGTAPTDTDHDGIPDSWETSHGLNLNNEADGNLDRDGDGYTNVEEYINTLLF